jgi:poly(3-hydroxybutyrate) depolymerase
MNPTRFACILVIVAALLAFPQARAQDRPNPSQQGSIDAAFQKFWAARSPAEAGRAVEEIVKSGVSFDEALRRLKLGRAYTAQKTGVVKLTTQTNGIEHHYALNVPANYDPARRYQVRFQLHGGVGGREDNQPRGTGEIGALAGAEQIYVIPYAWLDAPWWSDDQVVNLERIVDAIKRTYNIDENRVAVAGVSDGATGAYYIAMRETTPYASILPLNGFIMVLSNDDIDDATLSPNNLRNKPMFVINGGRDRLYPISNVEPFVKHLMAGGVDIAYHPKPEAEHNTRWWPEMKDTFEKFVADHPRDPHPGKLTWETMDSAHNRAHWLVIDQIGAQSSDAGDVKAMPDLNSTGASGALAKYGPGDLFARRKAAGRVDLVRNGNTIEATTKGVSAFTLLLSPDKFDFSQPVKVVANGRAVFEGRVQRSLETLVKWAARDNDRSMLYGAELKIDLTR